MASGPFVVIPGATPGATPLLAWGDDSIVERAHTMGYKQLVLTCAGCQHTRYNPPGLLINRGCGYKDRGTADPVAYAYAQTTVLRCAPSIAANIRRGMPTLITCAAGENRSALMTARVYHELTGQAGEQIVAFMLSVTTQAFSNGAFRRWAQSWPASAGIRQSAGGGLWWGAAATALLLLAWWKWGTKKRVFPKKSKLGACSPKRQRTFPHGCSLVVEPTNNDYYERQPSGGVYPFSKEGWAAALRRAHEIGRSKPKVSLRCGPRSWDLMFCRMRETMHGETSSCEA